MPDASDDETEFLNRAENVFLSIRPYRFVQRIGVGGMGQTRPKS